MLAALDWMEAIRLGITVGLDEIPMDEYMAMQVIAEERAKFEGEKVD